MTVALGFQMACAPKISSVYAAGTFLSRYAIAKALWLLLLTLLYPLKSHYGMYLIVSPSVDVLLDQQEGTAGSASSL